MSVLSAQSIRRLCHPEWDHEEAVRQRGRPMIEPFVERDVVHGKSFGLSACTYDCRIAEDLLIFPGQARLASTMERFCLPSNICGSVLDKSSYARIFVSAFNTHLDPGWAGYLTVELANLGTNPVHYWRGDPVCQIKFEWLDEPTDLPYTGKYHNQEAGPQAARNDR